MTIKQISTYLIGTVILIGIGYIYGKYNSSSNIKIKTIDNKIIDTHTVKTETQTKKKDGTIQIVTTTDTVQSSNEIKNTSETIKSISPRWTISALVAEDVNHLNLVSPTYGVSVTKQFIGPINIGIFAFTNGLVGVSIGATY